MGSVEQLGHIIESFYFPLKQFFPFAFFLLVFSPSLAFAWLYWLFPLSSFLYPLLHWLSCLFFLLPSSPLTLLYQSVGCAFVRLLGSNQIHFGIGCVQPWPAAFERQFIQLELCSSIWSKIDVGKLHTPFFQNVSSIAHINCWWTKGICHFVMVMSGLVSRNNTMKERRYLNKPNPPKKQLTSFKLNYLMLAN